MLYISVELCFIVLISQCKDGIMDIVKVSIDSSMATKCMGKYGCFTIDPPFGLSPPKRSLATLPLCQEKIFVKFFLWTRNNPHKDDVIYAEDADSLKKSNFNPYKPTKFLIHGWTQHGKITWILEAKKELIIHGDYNVISVDWHIGAKSLHMKSSGNTQTVGVVTASLIQQIQKVYCYPADMIHLIGFSMGCQIAGYVGERIDKIGRITALDPCRLDFDHSHPVVRIDPSDAQFVDVIHTDSSVTSITKRGATQDVGHLDFFPNGAKNHPRCRGRLKKRRKKRWIDFGEILYCSHVSSYHYFVASINSKCPLIGFACDSYENFLRGKCHQGCGADSSLCARMGLDAAQWKRNAKPSSTKMFLLTAIDSPYCLSHYYIELICSHEAEDFLYKFGRNTAKLYITLFGSLFQTGYREVNYVSTRFTTKPKIEFTLESKYLGTINRVDLKWTSGFKPSPDVCGPPYKANHHCDKCTFCFIEIRILNLETNTRSVFYTKNSTFDPSGISIFEETNQKHACQTYT